MTYFAKVNFVSNKKVSKTTYFIFDESVSSPILTEELLRENQQFKEFLHDYKPKTVYVDYLVYYTEEELYNSMQPEVFESVIALNANFYSQGELIIGSKEVRKARNISVGKSVILTLLVAALACGTGVYVGSSLMKRNLDKPIEPPKEVLSSDGGMIIPEQSEVEPDAELLTVSIDRSYSAVPTEDLELKAEIIKGKATITLPEFSKTDFFNHVFGYTWGFSTIPDGKKIEYYGGQTYEFTENTRLYRVLVKYAGGSGTKEDPYRIDYYDQLELMAEEGARGYFKQTADISFPNWASHVPINTVNELKSDPDSEYFEYDGNNYVIDNLTSPLFAKVSGATIKNVNVRNAVIENSKCADYGAIVCNAYNYRYKTDDKAYTTGETKIKHCSVSHSSIKIGAIEEATAPAPTEQPTNEVVPPDLIEYDENGKVIEPTTEAVDEMKPIEEVKPAIIAEGFSIGAISGNGGQIEDCYVEDFGVIVNSSEPILNVGGISGKPANVLNSGVFNYSAIGNIFNAGGIAGSAAGSRMYDAQGKELPEYYGGNIQGCVVRKGLFNNKMSAGGIAGVGSSNALNPVISNCYANELEFSCGEYDANHNLIREGFAGGVLGSDGSLRTGHLITNDVSVASKMIIGKKDKSSYDDTVRQAPEYAYYQQSILTVINKNTINPDQPKEIFTGIFKFGDAAVFGSESGSLSYPETIEDLFAKTKMEGTN